VRRGDLTVNVSATGQLQPTNQVDVGSELSGTVETVLVDENDRVRRGQVLARLDLTKLNEQVAQSRAALESARARLLQAAATVRETSASLARLNNLARLTGGDAPAKADLDAASAAASRAQADQAAARAAVAQAAASLRTDETNLRKATIRSPIDGVVLIRKVEPGQTVAASFQAPVLFTLAEDLSQMELQVDIDEADVGEVRVGQPASFTVDAYPARRFPARIVRVNVGSEVKDGVVSYKGVLDLSNPDLSLRPGMTATAQITTTERRKVLLAPNAALRFLPPAVQARPRSVANRLLPRMPRMGGSRRSETVSGNGLRRLWVLQDGRLRALQVRAGATDGQWTEVSGPGLRQGLRVVTGAASPGK
jgi:HlyD family secretion protein